MLNFLRITGGTGALVFAALWFVIALMPKEMERAAVGFVKVQITADIQARFPALAPGGVNAGLQKLSDRFGLQSAQLDTAKDSDLPEAVGAIVSRICGCDGPSQEQVAMAVRASMKERMTQLGLAQSRLAEIIKGRYDSIIAALRLDLMIFLGTNAVAFVSLLCVTFAPTQKKALAIYPAVLLLVAVFVSSAIYLFNTDWFYAILFQNYWGYSYSLLMVVIFGFLIDIALNHARITLRIVEAMPNAFVPVC